MLRRPPTVLSLTAEDLKAYEDRHEAEVFKAALAAQKQTLTPNTRQPNETVTADTNTTTTTTTSSSSYEDLSDANNGPDEEEDSYCPRRYRTIDDEDDGDIYRNEVEASPSSNPTSAADDEDHVMTELAPEELEAREMSTAPVATFGRRAAAAAVTPTPGVTAAGRAYGATSTATPEAPARQTRSRDERITGRGSRR